MHKTAYKNYTDTMYNSTRNTSYFIPGNNQDNNRQYFANAKNKQQR